MEHEHTVEAIHERLAAGPRQNYLRDWIYGGIDGSVTTFAIVSGVVGARLSPWIILVMGFSYGMPQEVRSPWLAAITTFSAFIVCGLVPLLPYLFGSNEPLALSIVMTGGVFFAIGSVKSRWSSAAWWRSGLSTLAVGVVAAGLAYAVGLLLNQLTQQ